MEDHEQHQCCAEHRGESELTLLRARVAELEAEIMAVPLYQYGERKEWAVKGLGAPWLDALAARQAEIKKRVEGANG